MRKNLILILRIIVVVASLVFLFFKVDVKQMFFEVLIKLPLWVLLSSVGLAVFRTWLNGIRWKLLNTDFSNQLNNWDYFRYMMISTTFNLVMPGALGGDIIKAMWVGSDLKRNRAENILSIFTDRAVGMLSIIILGVIAYSLSPFFNVGSKLIVWIVASIFLALLIVLIILVKNRKFERLLKNWNPKNKISISLKKILSTSNDIIKYHVNKPTIFFYSILLSLIIHSTFFAYNYFIAHFLKIYLSFFDISMISCLVWLITAIPISISGLGIREISYVSLLGLYGVSAEQATALSLYVFFVSIILGLIGLPFNFSMKRQKSYNK